jgi:hypothetical protein
MTERARLAAAGLGAAAVLVAVSAVTVLQLGGPLVAGDVGAEHADDIVAQLMRRVPARPEDDVTVAVLRRLPVPA